MIAVDSSVLVAIFGDEPERLTFSHRIIDDEAIISAASVLECSIVMRLSKRMGARDAEDRLDALLAEFAIAPQAVTLDQLRIARAAHAVYGKGTGHGAGLNFGDCFSYALAKALDVPLLYKGNDFARTDIVSALA